MGDEPPSPYAGPRVEVGDLQEDEAVDLDALAEVVRAVLVGEGVTVAAEANLVLVGEQAMAEMNGEHLGGDGPTDVLSFPIDGPALVAGEHVVTTGPVVLLGDVVICPAVARRNAEARGSAFTDELRLLAAHGALHLLGHDHADEPGAIVMREREQRYAGRAGATAPPSGEDP